MKRLLRVLRRSGLWQHDDEVSRVGAFAEGQRDGRELPAVDVRHAGRRRHHRESNRLLGRLKKVVGAGSEPKCSQKLPNVEPKERTFTKFKLSNTFL